MAAEAQWERKIAYVERALGQPLNGVHRSPLDLGYRARLTLGRGADGACVFRQAGSHEEVAIRHCPVARPEINAVLERMPPLPPEVRNVELRSDGKGVVVSLQAPGRGASPDLSAFQPEVLGIAGLALNGGPRAGDCRSYLSVAGIDHAHSPSTFFQVNLEVNELLVGRVLEEARASAPSGVLDLYAGAGNLSLPLAAEGTPITLMEREGAALADARRTAERHGIPLETIGQDVARFQGGDLFFDLALLDPPRAGAPGVMEELLLTRPQTILYVSCNPKALTRDTRPARKAGYTVSSLELFDMFPQTDHCEILCVLRRP
jgi:23S rRNA (uracil1939-C5)-methyltransferase